MSRHRVRVSCPCTERFEVPASMVGGLANCPRCRKAVEVPGGPEPLFWVLLGAGALVVLGISAAGFAIGGPVAGGIALGVGGGVLGLVVLAS